MSDTKLEPSRDKPNPEEARLLLIGTTAHLQECILAMISANEISMDTTVCQLVEILDNKITEFKKTD